MKDRIITIAVRVTSVRRNCIIVMFQQFPMVSVVCREHEVVAVSIPKESAASSLYRVAGDNIVPIT
jgi:hypothetical protein